MHEVYPKIVLDYGSGVGWFRAFSPPSIIVDTYDIMDTPQTGITNDYYDLITMWDVLEHLPDFSVLDNLLKITDYFAITVPIKSKSVKLSNWIHYKPGEHLHYFTEESIEELFNNRGFFLLKDGYPEIDCGIRKDIYSAIFKRRSKFYEL